MSGYRPSGNLIIGGQTFHTDAPIINWREGPGWDATREYCMSTQQDSHPNCPGGVPYGKLPLGPYTKRFSFRPRLRQHGMTPPYEAVKASIRQFVIHHDGCTSADMCFSVLQNERGLSVHFLLDNDGTIYQTIDLGLMAYHASEWNIDSIGVEMCNKGDAKTYPGLYQTGPFKRDLKTCKINGHAILAYDYTKAQYDAFDLLCRALQRLLPNLPAEFPQSTPGKQHWGTIPKDVSTRFAGYIGHYHLWDQKWDPGPFEFEPFCRRLRGAFCYPIYPKGEPKKTEDRPLIPDKPDELKDDSVELYKANEVRADGGFFPVGPWGETRLWHGGIHVAGKDAAPVFAPFPGRLVAARFGKSSSIGSNNFVLLRHDMNLGASRVQFYSLYMHLADELTADKPVAWLDKSALWKANGGKAGDVVLLDEAIEAGSQIGRIGRAGPAELSKPQLHVEFFSTAELFAGMPGAGVWTIVDGTAGGRFCDAKEINDIIDTNKDGMLSKQELASFFSSGNGAQLHYVVPLHVSEWTAEPSWAEALRVPKDFKKLKPAEIDALVADQITPGLWWDARVAAHCRLPPDGIVYHYHPVTFLAWFNQQLLDAAATGEAKIDEKDTREVPKGITDDFGDKDGTTMRSRADVSEDPCNKKLLLNDLVQGFDAPECTP